MIPYYIYACIFAIISSSLSKCVEAGQGNATITKVANATVAPKSFSLNTTNLAIIHLHDQNQVLLHCPRDSFGQFLPCKGPLSEVSIFTAPALAQGDNIKAPDFVLAKNLTDNGLVSTLKFRRYAPNIFSVQNAYVNSQGQVFSGGFLYASRGEDIDDLKGDGQRSIGKREYSTEKGDRIIKVKGPALVLTEHHRKNIYSDLFEGILSLIASFPILKGYPNIYIIIEDNYKFEKSKFYPILATMGIDFKSFEFVKVNTKHALVQAPLAFIPQRLLQYPPRILTLKLREYVLKMLENPRYKKVPSGASGPGIVVHTGKGSAPVGLFMKAILEFVAKKFKKDRKVIRFIGTENFNTMTSMFSESTVFISTHSSMLSNLIFMAPNSTVIEILPPGILESSKYSVVSSHIGFDHYQYSPPIEKIQIDVVRGFVESVVLPKICQAMKV